MALIKETGLKTRETVLESKSIRMAISILVIGKRTNEKEKDVYMFLMNLDSLKKATLEIGN